MQNITVSRSLTGLAAMSKIVVVRIVEMEKVRERLFIIQVD
jgi:hypothetical protein